MTSDEWLRESPDGVSLLVKVIPRAGVTRLSGTRDGRLLVRLAAPPVDGAANEALIAFFAGILRTPARNITLTDGAHSRNKRLIVAGVSATRFREIVSPASE